MISIKKLLEIAGHTYLREALPSDMSVVDEEGVKGKVDWTNGKEIDIVFDQRGRQGFAVHDLHWIFIDDDRALIKASFDI